MGLPCGLLNRVTDSFIIPARLLHYLRQDNRVAAVFRHCHEGLAGLDEHGTRPGVAQQRLECLA